MIRTEPFRINPSFTHPCNSNEGPPPVHLHHACLVVLMHLTKKDDPYKRRCPTCFAFVGGNCRGPRGGVLRKPHEGR